MRRVVEQTMGPGELVQLFGSFQPHLERIVGGSVRAPGPVVEDACQVAWLRLIRDRERIDAQSAPGWLVTTAIHTALRLMRQEGREDSLELILDESREDSFTRADASLEDVVWRRQRVGGLRSLPVRQQRLIWLRALGLSYDEMAFHEHCTSRTVRRQLERARRRLRALEDAPADRQAA